MEESISGELLKKKETFYYLGYFILYFSSGINVHGNINR